MQKTQETWVQSLDWEDPLEEEMATHSLQYSCLGNSMDGGAWRATAHEVAESDTAERTHTHIPKKAGCHRSLQQVAVGTEITDHRSPKQIQ